MSVPTPSGVRPTDFSAGRSFRYAGRLFTLLVTSAEAGGRWSVVEELAQRGTSLDLPLRVHTRETLCAYVLEGELTVEIGDEQRPLAAGRCAAIPPGLPHRFVVHSDTARLITVYAPGGFDGFLRDVGEPAGSSAPWPSAADTPLDVERLVTVGARYGVEIVAAA